MIRCDMVWCANVYMYIYIYCELCVYILYMRTSEYDDMIGLVWLTDYMTKCLNATLTYGITLDYTDTCHYIYDMRCYTYISHNL